MLRAPRILSLLLLVPSLGLAQSFVGSGLTRLQAPNNGLIRTVTPSGLLLGYYSSENISPGFTYDGTTFTTLPHFGGGNSDPSAINASGVIVGSSSAPDFNTYAFRLVGNTLTNLGTLGGSISFGRDINDAGTIIGTAQNASGYMRAFSYSGTAMTDLGTFGGDSSGASDINQAGAIVGNAQRAGGDYRPFLYTGSGLQDLGSFGGTYGNAFAINEAGKIVGGSDNLSGNSRAFLYQNGAMEELATPHGEASVALGINASDEIVGWIKTGEIYQAFYYANGSMVTLDSLFASSLSNGATTSGFVSLVSADRIFDDGRVFGFGTYFDAATGTTTEFQPYLLTVSAIPEPSTYAALAGLGALGFALYRRRQIAARDRVSSPRLS